MDPDSADIAGNHAAISLVMTSGRPSSFSPTAGIASVDHSPAPERSRPRQVDKNILFEARNLVSEHAWIEDRGDGQNTFAPASRPVTAVDAVHGTHFAYTSVARWRSIDVECLARA